MGKLLKLEFRKLLRQKSLYICLAIMLGLILMSAIMYKALMSSSFNLGDLVSSLNNINGIFFTLTTFSNADFFIIIGIVIAITYCFDFEEQTVKNVLSKGYSKKSLFFSKVISIMCATTFMFVVCFLFSFAIGSAFFGIGEGSLLTLLGLICLQYLICLAYSMVFTFICALCKKMALAISMNIVVPLAVALTTSLFDALIKSESFKVADYWLDGMVSNLSSLAATSTAMIIAAVGSIIYIAVFIFIGVMISKKTEV